jgi:hypothetical protein
VPSETWLREDQHISCCQQALLRAMEVEQLFPVEIYICQVGHLHRNHHLFSFQNSSLSLSENAG